MNVTEFHTIADELLQLVPEQIESQSRNAESDYMNGVLDIKCPDGKQYVINKHAPTMQIWMSSPFSSASKFSFVDGKWVKPSGEIFPDILISELKNNYNITLSL